MNQPDSVGLCHSAPVGIGPVILMHMDQAGGEIPDLLAHKGFSGGVCLTHRMKDGFKHCGITALAGYDHCVLMPARLAEAKPSRSHA